VHPSGVRKAAAAMAAAMAVAAAAKTPFTSTAD